MILSLMYCFYCDKLIDTDFEDQHFDEQLENCMKELEDKQVKQIRK